VVLEERVGRRQVDFQFTEKVLDGFRGCAGGAGENVFSVIDTFNNLRGTDFSIERLYGSVYGHKTGERLQRYY
jgi:hypothetical protein